MGRLTCVPASRGHARDTKRVPVSPMCPRVSPGHAIGVSRPLPLSPYRGQGNGDTPKGLGTRENVSPNENGDTRGDTAREAETQSRCIKLPEVA